MLELSSRLKCYRNVLHLHCDHYALHVYSVVTIIMTITAYYSIIVQYKRVQQHCTVPPGVF